MIIRFTGYTILSMIVLSFFGIVATFLKNPNLNIIDISGAMGIATLVTFGYFLISDIFNSEIKKIHKDQYKKEFIGTFGFIFIFFILGSSLL